MDDLLSRLSADPEDSDRHSSGDSLRMLGLMSEWGVSGGLLAVLLELADFRMADADRRFLVGPIVIHETPWNDTIPEWMFEQARSERFAIVVEKKPWIVGPAELTAVMYGAMLEAPRPHDLTELYLWASVNASARHYQRDAAEIWQVLNHQPIADAEVIERGGRLWNEYRQLADAIRHKVDSTQLQRERSERREKEERQKWAERRAEQYAPPAPPEPVARQMTIF